MRGSLSAELQDSYLPLRASLDIAGISAWIAQ